MISHFSQEPFEGTLHIEDADLQKMAKVLNDVNIKECPYFDLSDKYGNSARYYRENQWIPCSERLPNKPSGDEYCWCSSHKADVPACEYIVMIKGAELPTALFWDGCHWFDINGDETLYPVVAWQPLPEPWEEAKE